MSPGLETNRTIFNKVCKMTIISSGSQTGGLDAMETSRKLFHAFKAAEKGIEFDGFPFDRLSFILRVDGEIQQYNLSGPGYVDIDRKMEYLSVDIGVTIPDRANLVEHICQSIRNSQVIIAKEESRHKWKVDYVSLNKALEQFVKNFRQAIQNELTTNS